jgi:DNA-binding transcriptional MerR regulator
MPTSDSFSLSEAGRLFGVSHHTIRDLLRLLGELPGKHPTKNNAKAITPEQVARLAAHFPQAQKERGLE